MPMPGPTLPTADATALIEVIISMPKAVRKIEPMANTNRYKKINANRLKVIWLEIEEPLSITGITAFGCNLLLNSSNPFLISNIILTIFIPPLVLPAEAPENRNKKKTNDMKDPHRV